jgi:ankyrin repeat protein
MNGNFLSPLSVACQDGDLDMVQDPLLSDISLHEIRRVESNGSTSLHAACRYNYPETVKLLLESEATRTKTNSLHHNKRLYLH